MTSTSNGAAASSGDVSMHGAAADTVRSAGLKARRVSFEAARDEVDERTPLVSPEINTSSSDEEGGGLLGGGGRRGRGGGGDGDGDGDARFDGRDEEAYQATKGVWYMVLLTISIGGLQIAWSVELSNGSPYLLSLGLSKSLMALVWIAGPLSGTLVQPYVGMLSDNCRVSWGKRKPFMLGGSVATIVSLMFLAWTKEIVGGVLGLFGADPASRGVHVAIIVVAVLWVYILDFAINTVQAAIRAFIVDCAPAHQQEAANSMASRIVGVGNIVGYVAGYVNLPQYIWWLGDSQFKVLCAVASIALGGTVMLSTSVIRERDPRLQGPPPKDAQTIGAFFYKIFTSIKRLPPQVKKVCTVQFFSWIGFFPMLFYTSSYIGEIYVEPKLEENPNMTPEELDRLYEEATRVGTFALLIYSVVSLLTNLFVPFFIAPTYDSQPLVLLDTTEPGESAGIVVPHPKDSDVFSDDVHPRSWLDYLIIPGLTLRRAWMLSLILYSAAMFCTVLVRTVPAATALIGLVGITWAMTLWAPWAIISAEIARTDALWRARKLRQRRLAGLDGGDGVVDAAGPSGSGVVDVDVDDDDDEDVPDQAGVVLGIHNMAIAAPQMISSLASSVIFRVLQKPRGVPGDHSIAAVLALGGIAVLVSAWFVHTLNDEGGLPADLLATVEDGDGDGVFARDIDDGADEDDDDVAVPPDHGESALADSMHSNASRPSLRPGTSYSNRSRRQSHESLPRRSMGRANLARSTSFGGGLEY